MYIGGSLTELVDAIEEVTDPALRRMADRGDEARTEVALDEQAVQVLRAARHPGLALRPLDYGQPACGF